MQNYSRSKSKWAATELGTRRIAPRSAPARELAAAADSTPASALTDPVPAAAASAPAVVVLSSGSSSSGSSSTGPVPSTISSPPTTTTTTAKLAPKKSRHHRPPRTLSTYKHVQHLYKRFRKATHEIRNTDGKNRIANRNDFIALKVENRELKAEVEKLKAEALKENQKELVEAVQKKMVRESEDLRVQLRELNGAVNYLLKAKPEELKADGVWYDQMKEGGWKSWGRME